MNRSESELVRDVLDALKLFPRRLKAWRCQSGIVKVARGWMHLAPAGTPDIIGYFRGSGRMFGIECKVSHKRACVCEPCEAQREWKRDAEPDVLVIDNVRHVDDALRGLGLPLPPRQFDLTGTES